MTLQIKDDATASRLQRHLNKSIQESADALEKLSSGTVFTSGDARPADRAIAQGLEYKLRSLNMGKRSINDATSVLQTAEAGMSEISNLILRLKELNIAASSSTLSDKERKFLFVEYEAIHNEINRIAGTTEFNGIPLLNGEANNAVDELTFRIGDPVEDESGATDGDDLNLISLSELKSIVVTTTGLGIQSAAGLLKGLTADEGVTLDDARELLESTDPTSFPTIYDEALETISEFRANFGAIQSRLARAADYVDVYAENIAAAKSNIADTDFAKETARLIESRVLTQAGTAIMAQANLNAGLSLNLLNALI